MTDKPAEDLPADPAEHRSARPNPEPKIATLRKLLARRTGTTVVQIQKQLGWQPHTIRAAISRLRSSGVTVELDRSGRVTRYRAMPVELQ